MNPGIIVIGAFALFCGIACIGAHGDGLRSAAAMGIIFALVANAWRDR